MAQEYCALNGHVTSSNQWKGDRSELCQSKLTFQKPLLVNHTQFSCFFLCYPCVFYSVTGDVQRDYFHQPESKHSLRKAEGKRRNSPPHRDLNLETVQRCTWKDNVKAEELDNSNGQIQLLPSYSAGWRVMKFIRVTEKKGCIFQYTLPCLHLPKALCLWKPHIHRHLEKKAPFSLNPVRVEHHPTCSNMTYSINIKRMHGSKGCKEIHHTVLQGLTVKFKKNYTYQIWIYIKF